MSNDETQRGYPLPSPDNIAYDDAKRIRDAITQIDADLTDLNAKETPMASETISGRFRLATATEAAAGTETSAVPTIKRTKDMINSALQAAQDALTALQNHIAEELSAADDEIDQAIDDMNATITTRLNEFNTALTNGIAAKLDKAGGTMTGKLIISSGGYTVTGDSGVTGKLSISALLTASGGVAVAGSVAATGNVTGKDLTAARSATTGYFYFGSGANYIGYDGTNFISTNWLVSPNGSRYAAYNEIIAASTANATFVTATRWVYGTEFECFRDQYSNGSWVVSQSESNPGIFTGLYGSQLSSNGFRIRVRYSQYCINGSWYTASWAS